MGVAEALIVVGVALNVVFWLFILGAYALDRVSMEFRRVAKWAILVALMPALGVLGLYLERTDGYGVFFAVMVVALMVLGLVLLARDRHVMRTGEVVKWAILIVSLPGLGVLGYFFWRLENAVQRGTPSRRDRSAPFLRKPTLRDR